MGLKERLARAEPVRVHPLEMIARDHKGNEQGALAINEVSLLRQSRQAAKIRISVDGVAPNSMSSWPMAFCFPRRSAAPPIICRRMARSFRCGAGVLALTPISAFRPRRWRGALLPHAARVQIDVIETEKRPVSATADFTEVRNVHSVSIRECREIELTMLFDPEHNLEERVLKEQFLS